MLGISAVERDTGLGKDTLRVWERRYGFPNPARDANGERVYARSDVEKLRVLRRLIDAGCRPGKIIGLPMNELTALSTSLVSSDRWKSDSDLHSADLDLYIGLIRAQKFEQFRDRLSQCLLRDGLERFITQLCGPLTRMVGEAWSRGELEIYEEHLYTETMQGVLRNAITSMPKRGEIPKVLLSTFPDEHHGLGLLMAEAILDLEGCSCTSLGTQTPLLDIVKAISTGQFHVVALSFSSAYNLHAMTEGLTTLRAMLPQSIAIWVGGAAVARVKKLPEGVVALRDLPQIRQVVQDQRSLFNAHSSQ